MSTNSSAPKRDQNPAPVCRAYWRRRSNGPRHHRDSAVARNHLARRRNTERGEEGAATARAPGRRDTRAGGEEHARRWRSPADMACPLGRSCFRPGSRARSGLACPARGHRAGAGPARCARRRRARAAPTKPACPCTGAWRTRRDRPAARAPGLDWRVRRVRPRGAERGKPACEVQFETPLHGRCCPCWQGSLRVA
jgi:hypothetical protein